MVHFHSFVSLNNKKICHKICEDKIQFVKKRELFGFELSVLESVSSRKNISVSRHVK